MNCVTNTAYCLENNLKSGEYMGQDTIDLEKQIAEKNSILNMLDENEKRNLEKIKAVKLELDRLLYLYYKSLKSKFTVFSFL